MPQQVLSAAALQNIPTVTPAERIRRLLYEQLDETHGTLELGEAVSAAKLRDNTMTRDFTSSVVAGAVAPSELLSSRYRTSSSALSSVSLANTTRSAHPGYQHSKDSRPVSSLIDIKDIRIRDKRLRRPSLWRRLFLKYPLRAGQSLVHQCYTAADIEKYRVLFFPGLLLHLLPSDILSLHKCFWCL